MARPRLPQRYRRRTPGFWAAFAAAWAGGIASLLLLIALASGGENNEEALAARQRAIVMIESGELIHGPQTRPDRLDAEPQAELPPASIQPDAPEDGALTSTPMPGSFGDSGMDAVEMPANRPEPITPPADATGTDDPPAEPVQPVPAEAADLPPIESETGDALRAVPAPPPNAEPVAALQSGLAVAPQPDMVEQGEAGSLPVAPSEQRASWRVYGRPSAAEKPLVAIVVTNLGLGNFTSEQALTLPLDVTLAFSPYGRQSPAWAAKARELGFEAMLELPAEPSDYPRTDPGPYALLGSLTPEENLRRMHWVLSRFPGYTGVVIPPESSLHRYKEQADYLASEAARRGLIWLQGAPRADAPGISGKVAGTVLQADIVLDETLTGEAIQSRLGELAALARRQGTAIAIARPYPLTLDNISRWLGKEDRGVKLAPLSAVAKLREGTSAGGAQ